MGSSTRVERSPSQRLGVADWVAAALDLIGEEGLTAVKIDRLAQRLGVTKGSFYWHFDDLASFLGAVADEWCRNRRELRRFLDGIADLPPRERLDALIGLVNDVRYWRLERASREWARTNRRVRDTIARSDGWILAAERQAFIELGFGPKEAEMRANALFYAGMGFILAGPRNARVDLSQVNALLDLLSSHGG